MVVQLAKQAQSVENYLLSLDEKGSLLAPKHETGAQAPPHPRQFLFPFSRVVQVAKQAQSVENYLPSLDKKGSLLN